MYTSNSIKILLFFIFNLWYCFGNVLTQTADDELESEFEQMPSVHDGSCTKWGNHKSAPTAEFDLEGECKWYEKESCCTRNTTVNIHSQFLYDDEQVKSCAPYMSSLSDDCRRDFRRHLCYFECSPDFDTRILKKNEIRYANLPLCEEECNLWFESCKYDFVCFFRHDLFNNNLIRIPENCSTNRCLKFKDVYSSAKEMCETIFRNTWKVTKFSSTMFGPMCITLPFDSPALFSEHYTYTYTYTERDHGGVGGAVLLRRLAKFFLLIVVFIFCGIIRLCLKVCHRRCICCASSSNTIPSAPQAPCNLPTEPNFCRPDVIVLGEK